MSTTITRRSVSNPRVQNEQDFRESLDSIFSKPYTAVVFPDQLGISSAKINLACELEMNAIERLIKLAAAWKLKLAISRSGAGLRIQFS